MKDKSYAMLAEKAGQTRTYDPDGFRRRAACVCTRDESEQEVLLVSSSGSSEHWVVPGGGIEPNEDSVVAALREVEEEAGVKGLLRRCLGVFENKDKKTRTSVYVLLVKEMNERWVERELGRERRWFKLGEARRHLSSHKPNQVQYLDWLEKR